MPILQSFHGINLSNQEKLIRNDWFRSMCIYLLGTLATLLGYYVALAIYVDLDTANLVLKINLFNLLSTTFSTTIIYYTAYVKFGFRWIRFFLVMSLIRMTIDGIKELVDLFNIADSIVFLSLGILFLISISLYVYFWTHCKRLYKMNKLLSKKSPLLQAAQVYEDSQNNQEENLQPIQNIDLMSKSS
ncbi:MAG: hypothetical protein H0T62_07550 [Parachlamydiaceae bacterium]|nr:hypothetical protein [Parachlamydiaceae bacterium]